MARSTLAMLFKGGMPGGDDGRRPTNAQGLARGGEVDDELDGPEVSDEEIIAAEDIMDSLQSGYFGGSPSESDSKVERASKEAAKRARAKILAQALKAFCLIVDSGPHQEGPPEE